MKQTRRPVNPGLVFYEDVLKPLGISISQAAEMLEVSRSTLDNLINGKVALSPSMAIRIAQVSNTSPESWLLMQMKCSLWKARTTNIPKLKRLPQNTIKTSKMLASA
ncbi:MAG: HigA family addiction module antidote protein [Spirochaetaceae bacterium]|jgi:addiction module HigA family antidote|nr:HigA family addiction module antidote protein [Spirochaetaceae bacterium]